MTDPFRINAPLKLVNDSSIGSVIFDVNNASSKQVTITSNQQTSDLAITLADPTVGQCIAATSGTTGAWVNPVDVRLTGVSLNAANFRAVNFTGNITATDAGSGVATVNVLPNTSRQYHAYDSTGGVSTASVFTVNFNTVTRNTASNFTNAAGQITINTADVYLIVFNVTCAITSGNASATNTAFLELNTGGGFVEVAGSRVYGTGASSTNGRSTMTTSRIIQLAATNIIRVRTVLFSGAACTTVINASEISITNTGVIQPPTIPAANTMIVQDSGVSLGGTYTTLNFLNDISAVDQGGGVAALNVQFPAQTVAVKEEGTSIGTVFQTLNFIGPAITATDAGGNQANVTVTIPTPTVTVKEEGTSLGSFSSLNFVGSQVTATDAGAGQATITVTAPTSTVVVKEEGTSLGAFSSLNFIGATVTATDAGSGQANVTLATPTIAIQKDDVAQGSYSTVNFTDTGVAVVTVTDNGSGKATVDVNVPTPTISVKDEGGASLGAFSTLNFVGPGVTATNAGGGQANVTVDTSLAVKNGGSALGSFTTMNFVGDIVATNAGGGQTNVTVDKAFEVKLNGVSQGTGFRAIDFLAQNTVTTSGTTAIVDPRVSVQDASVAIGRFTTLNFTGSIPVVTDGGGGVANVFIDKSGLGGTIGVATYHDQKTLGTNGGSSGASNVWTRRDLNTADSHNNITGASVAANQITLPTGTYFIQATAPGFRCDLHKIRLQNITTGTTAIEGSSSFSKDNANSGQAGATLFGVVTVVGSPVVFELQHNVTHQEAVDGFGIATGIGTFERYACVVAILLSVS
jgi:hypothetical protein